MKFPRALRLVGTGSRRVAAIILLVAALALSLGLGALHRHDGASTAGPTNPCATCAIAHLPADAPPPAPAILVSWVVEPIAEPEPAPYIESLFVKTPEQRGPPRA